MLQANNLTLIGEIKVVSGKAIIGDPCWLPEWKQWNSEAEDFEEYLNREGEFGDLGAINVNQGKGFGQLGNFYAVAFSTGYGDGLYPVYADITEDGEVGMIVVDFLGEYEVEDN